MSTTSNISSDTPELTRRLCYNSQNYDPMKTTAIVYEQHQEVAIIPIEKIEYVYPLVDGIRVNTSIPNGWGYKSYEGDEIEFV